MEWPPTNFMTYDNFKSDLQDAINKHPHFEEWLINKFKIENDGSNIRIPCEFSKIDFTVEKLKQLYYNEQNNVIYKNLITRSILELKLKSITISEEQEDYNKRKSEYDSVIAHNEILIRNGCKNIPKLIPVSKSLKMIFYENLSKSIERKIENHEEFLNKIHNIEIL
tara:strand:- start:231 stop:731 length:501 start_codon:yes stop_codon:yes gene_type:complete